MATLGVIADDLTGATDIAITLTTAGFRTTVVLGDEGTVETIPVPDGTDAVVVDRKSTRLNSSHMPKSRMPSSA